MITEFAGLPTTAALEQAALAVGRVAAIVQGASPAIGAAMLRRHAVLATGEADSAARALILGQGARADSIASRYHDALAGWRTGDAGPDVAARMLATAGLDPAIGARAHDAIGALLDTRTAHDAAIVRTATMAGIAVASAPAARDTARAAALIAASELAAAGCVSGPWLAPFMLDASARSAAVQVERSNAWGDWLRAWCRLLAREAQSAERAVRAALSRLADERAIVRREPRVGATDEAVLAYLHATPAMAIRAAAAALGLTTPTIGTSIERLVAQGLAVELTGHRRGRIWTSSTLLALTVTP